MSAETASEPKKSDKKASTKTSKFATEPGAQADSDSGLRT